MGGLDYIGGPLRLSDDLNMSKSRYFVNSLSFVLDVDALCRNMDFRPRRHLSIRLGPKKETRRWWLWEG